MSLEPIIAHPEEVVAFAHHGVETDIRWFVEGEESETARRFANGLACSQCCEVFPAPPSLATLQRFRDDYVVSEGGRRWFEEVGADRVARGCCPMCGAEVSAEMFHATHEGVQDAADKAAPI